MEHKTSHHVTILIASLKTNHFLPIHLHNMTSKRSKSSGKRKSPWHASERAILVPFKDQFRAADKQGRLKLLQDTVLPKFFELYPDVEGLERKDYKRRVKEWFANCARRKPVGSKWLLLPRATLQQVFLHERKDDILEEVRKLTDVTGGEPGYLGFYQKAAKLVKEGLDDDELEELQGMRDAWESKGWPQAERRK